jgi:hypothetical protein
MRCLTQYRSHGVPLSWKLSAIFFLWSCDLPVVPGDEFDEPVSHSTTSECFRIVYPSTTPYEISEDEFEDIGIQMIVNCAGWPPAATLQITGNGGRLTDVSLQGWAADMYELSVLTRLRGRTTWDLALLRANSTAGGGGAPP